MNGPFFTMRFDLKSYLQYVLKETLNYRIYLSAAIIGLFICFLMSHFSAVPFLVPFCVQVIVRSNVSFRNRHKEALVELPAQTEDPAFIMDQKGNILLSIGKTKTLLNRFRIRNIRDFINEEAVDRIINTALIRNTSPNMINSVESFSDKTFKWYEIKAKATGLQYGDKDDKILVWFQDISLRKIYHIRLRDLLRYSDSLIESLDKTTTEHVEHEQHFAAFILKEYEAVFITRADSQNNLNGHVFKNEDGRISKSTLITIHKESQAPINISRKKKQILTNDICAFPDDEAFMKANPFDRKVLSFIDFKIRNYITYNEADISIIAFNFRSTISAYEEQFFEIVVNIYRSMAVLSDLNQTVKKPSKNTISSDAMKSW